MYPEEYSFIEPIEYNLDELITYFIEVENIKEIFENVLDELKVNNVINIEKATNDIVSSTNELVEFEEFRPDEVNSKFVETWSYL